eukprot:TRINITY_DN968_c0_g1_i1.p1 TRINITY_DN968_c0_g1~~TRINITY_DN968_c0_g1_i1.p1  ORF type:complete len:576 (+),score=177.92 TRINITY_DN968_c0_g1_i1:94-1728(+)
MSFVAEVSTSQRATCPLCDSQILVGQLRVAENTTRKKWVHVDCGLKNEEHFSDEVKNAMTIFADSFNRPESTGFQTGCPWTAGPPSFNELSSPKTKTKMQMKRGAAAVSEEPKKKISRVEAKLKVVNVAKAPKLEPTIVTKLTTPSSSPPLSIPSEVVDYMAKVAANLFVYASPDLNHSEKIASFDLDWTVIRTQSGKVFPRGINDWVLFHDNVKAKMQSLVEDGYKIVIFTNQEGIGKGRITEDAFRTKVKNIEKELEVPLLVLAATHKDFWRKPAPGMWYYLDYYLNGGIKIDMEESFYCGDAAGRPAGVDGRKKKDFSASDYLFARNLGLAFKTPEQCFWNRSDWRPSDVDRNNALIKFEPSTLKSVRKWDLMEPKSSQEVVITVGPPACGKSFIASRVFRSYTRVNQDIAKTAAKCKKLCNEALARGESVIVDNTNRDAKTRSVYVQMAEKYGIPIRCIFLEADMGVVSHLNAFRSANPFGENRRVPDVALRSYFSKAEEPTVDEGFEEVCKTPFLIVEGNSLEPKQAYLNNLMRMNLCA